MPLSRPLLRGAALFIPLAGLVSLGCAMLATTAPGLRLESTFGLRWLYTLRGPREVPESLLLIPMTEAAGRALGQEVEVDRWPRSLHACLIRKLASAGPAAIVIDARFLHSPSRQAQDPATIRERYEPWVQEACALREGLAATAQLGEAIRAAGNVLLPSFLGQQHDPVAGLLQWETLPETMIAAGARGIAAFPLPEEHDRVNQFWTFYPAPDGSQLPQPTLATLALAVAVGHPPVMDLRATLTAARAAAVAGAAAPMGDPSLTRTLREPSRQRFNLYTAPGQLPALDYAAVLGARGAADLAAVRGRVVFVGAADARAQDRLDSYRTAYPAAQGRQYNGVELIATAYANLTDNSSLQLPQGWQTALLLLGFGGLLALIGWRLAPLPASLLYALLAACWLGFASHAFAVHYLWLPLAVPLVLQLPLLLLLSLLWHYLRSQGALVATRGLMALYVSQRVASRHLAAGADTGLQLVHGTVLATDASQYTQMVAQLGGDPRRLAPILNAYYDALSTPLAEAAPPGHIIDTAGDGMLALWDAPTDEAPPRLAACRAACAISAGVARFNAAHPDTPLPTRIGLHAGALALGDLEARGRRFFKAMGDVTNTASRIESLNKQLGTQMLVSAEVVSGLEEALALRPLGRFQLQGRLAPTTILELRGPAPEAGDAPRLAAFAAALAEFERGAWASAGQAFAALLTVDPQDGPAAFYRELCARYQREPPTHDDPGLVLVSRK